MSDVSMLCYICGNPAKHVCRLCGKFVCSDHFDAQAGLCSTDKGRGRTLPQRGRRL